MILRQCGGSSHLEPPHLCVPTSKNTAGAGMIFDLGAKRFQTLFSGRKDEVLASKATNTTADFTMEGPVRVGGGGAAAGAPPVSPLPFPAAWFGG